VETPLEVGMAVCDRTGRKVWLHRRPPAPGSEGFDRTALTAALATQQQEKGQ